MRLSISDRIVSLGAGPGQHRSLYQAAYDVRRHQQSNDDGGGGVNHHHAQRFTQSAAFNHDAERHHHTTAWRHSAQERSQARSLWSESSQARSSVVHDSSERFAREHTAWNCNSDFGSNTAFDARTHSNFRPNHFTNIDRRPNIHRHDAAKFHNDSHMNNYTSVTQFESTGNNRHRSNRFDPYSRPQSGASERMSHDKLRSNQARHKR